MLTWQRTHRIFPQRDSSITPDTEQSRKTGPDNVFLLQGNTATGRCVSVQEEWKINQATKLSGQVKEDKARSSCAVDAAPGRRAVPQHTHHRTASALA